MILISDYFFKTELLQGKTTDSFSFEVNNETTLPIALLEQYDELVIEGPKENFCFPKNLIDS